jgi:endonuclease/exonuclease/phosphatase family metal-dependent hydrolase
MRTESALAIVFTSFVVKYPSMEARGMSRKTAVFAIFASLFLFSFFVGCEHIESLSDQIQTQNSERLAGAPNGSTIENNRPANAGWLVSQSTAIRAPSLPPRNPQTILIASFNIQTFGVSKMSKPGIPEQLAEIIRQFDIVAIQEIRDSTNKSLPALVEYVNRNGAKYDYIISPPLGRTVSKEQYAYVFNTETIVSSNEFSYLVEDSQDLLHREPLVARFVTRVPTGFQPFRFTLVNMHSDPDEAFDESEVLSAVFKSIQNFEYANAGEDDVILLGDLNIEPRNFQSLARVPGLIWLFNEPTNTRRTRIWDNILLDRDLTNEFTGRFGVLDVEQMFRIGREEALAISDHLPIWAEFYVTEMPRTVPSRAADGRGFTLR